MRPRSALISSAARRPASCNPHTLDREHGLHPAQESGKAPHASLEYHSPLEGESERQGRSPRSIRRGANSAFRKSRSAALTEPQSETDLLHRHALSQSCAGVCPPPHQPSPFGSTSATPPQGGSDIRVMKWERSLCGRPGTWFTSCPEIGQGAPCKPQVSLPP